MSWILWIILVYLIVKEWNYWIYKVGKDDKGIYIEVLKTKDKIPNIYVGYYLHKYYLKDLFKKKEKDLF